jgi:toxin ParE1/3/4
MADYVFSAAAESDIQAIFLLSEENFGERQTDIYLDGLDRALRNLAETPRIGRTADDLRPGLFRFPYQSHMIFYTIEPDRIVIRRILHARMDFGSHL